MRNLLALIGFVALCLGVGVIGTVATIPNIPAWYAGLAKPAFNPPNWLFGPVWTALYISMGIAAWLVWRTGPAKAALGLFALQLAFNAAWSPLFFGLHWIGVALIDIVCLFFAIFATLLAFRKRSGFAALLIVPYLAWVGFASVLNFSIWRLN